jgi:hypothetical protein
MRATQAKEDATKEIAACAEIDKNRLLAEARGGAAASAVRVPALTAVARLRHTQAEEKAAEKAVNEALLMLGNLVHDSVLVDNNEARAASTSASVHTLTGTGALTRTPTHAHPHTVHRTTTRLSAPGARRATRPGCPTTWTSWLCLTLWTWRRGRRWPARAVTTLRERCAHWCRAVPAALSERLSCLCAGCASEHGIDQLCAVFPRAPRVHARADALLHAQGTLRGQHAALCMYVRSLAHPTHMRCTGVHERVRAALGLR